MGTDPFCKLLFHLFSRELLGFQQCVKLRHLLNAPLLGLRKLSFPLAVPLFHLLLQSPSLLLGASQHAFQLRHSLPKVLAFLAAGL